MSGRTQVLTPGQEVTCRRSTYGYKVDGQYYRRVTTLNALPKGWLSRWSANETAIRAIENFGETKRLLGEMSDEELARAADALREKRWREVPATVDAVYKDLKEAPFRKRDDAGDFGDAVHKTLEALIKGEPLPDSLTHEAELACAINAETLYRDLMAGGEIIHAEVTVIHPFVRVPYAGTFDFYARTRTGDRWVIDWKTSAKGPFVDWVTQQAAYYNAPYALVDVRDYKKVGKETETWKATVVDWGPQHIDRLGIVHVRPEFARLHEILPEHLEREWNVFRAASYVKLWSLDTDDYRKKPRVQVYSQPLLEVLA